MENIDNAICLIRFGTAAVMVLFGLSQIIHPEKWIDYIPDFFRKLSPMKPETSMRLHSLGNLALGLILITGFRLTLFTILSIIWWVTILPFAFKKNWAIGLRDLSITLSLIALYLLLKV